MPKHRISFLEGPFLHDQTHLFHVVIAAKRLGETNDMLSYIFPIFLVGVHLRLLPAHPQETPMVTAKKY